MWEINNSLQLLSFLRSLILGCLFCAFYDFFKGYRLVVNPSKNSVFLQDILYFSICAPITFCFLLSVTNGELRAYVFLGAILGFVLFKITISKFLVKILKLIFKWIFIFLTALNRVIFALGGWIFEIFNKISCFIKFFFKKAVKCLKKA